MGRSCKGHILANLHLMGRASIHVKKASFSMTMRHLLMMKPAKSTIIS